MIGYMVTFWCGNPSLSVSRLVAVVNLIYTCIMEFLKFIREKSGETGEYCLYETCEMLGTMCYVSSYHGYYRLSSQGSIPANNTLNQLLA